MANQIDEHTPKRAGSTGAIPEAGFLGKAVNTLGIVYGVAILSSAAILFLEVLLRYVFNSPTIWAHETVIFLTASSFIFGGLYVAARNAHIRVVLIYDLISPMKRRVFDVVISLVCSFACAFFAWASWQSVIRAVWTPAGDFRLETTGSAWDPPTAGLVKVFLFVVLILLAVQFAVLAFNYIRNRDG
ncbi:TRAP transporter small permease subunit [uncultured Ruegeria sp.]|uniref:TRAP transporter small permease subunit n=1 Tax=uncultured Ruegeria sp. TaxID=259304 RepID=UPI0026335EC5|nr:TRAP transporter small permease [uncultured Ruegeria sp.]